MKKRLILCLFCLLFVFALWGCNNNNNPTVLDTPSQLEINGTILSWTAVQGATEYWVQIDNNAPISLGAQTSCDLSTVDVVSQSGIYAISVMASGDGKNFYDSSWSEQIFYAVGTDGLLYTLSTDGLYYTLEGDVAMNSEIIIPSTHEGLPVAAIGERAFLNHIYLASIFIPQSIKSIGRDAFLGSGLFIDAVYDSVVYAHNWAVGIKGSLSTISLAEGTAGIADYAFFECVALSSVDIPASVGVVGENAFLDTGIFLRAESGSIVYADGWAVGFKNFAHDDSYRQVSLAEGTLGISNRAFAYNLFMTVIAIPDSATAVGDGAFYGCENLFELTIGSGITTINPSTFAYCHNLKSLTIPEGITTLGSSAFRNCISLQSISLPSTLTTICMDAFRNCIALQKIAIPPQVGTIQTDALRNCSSLAQITVDPQNKTFLSINGSLYTKDGTVLIQYAIFKSAATFYVPDGVTTIGEGAFAYCTSLKYVIMPQGLLSISARAFYYCNYLVSCKLPDTVQSIGNAAFYYCPRLYDFTLPAALKSIGDYALSGCEKIAEITIPSSVEQIGSWAFSYCYGLTSAIIGSNVLSIGESAFALCDALTIYCAPSQRPLGWHQKWNSFNCPVVWNYSL